MNLHAMPDPHIAIEGYSWMNPAILADPASRANHGVGADLCPGTDVRVFANHCVWTNPNACCDASKWSHYGCRVNSGGDGDRKSTRLNSSHSSISYAVFCLKKKKKT